MNFLSQIGHDNVASSSVKVRPSSVRTMLWRLLLLFSLAMVPVAQLTRSLKSSSAVLFSWLEDADDALLDEVTTSGTRGAGICWDRDRGGKGGTAPSLLRTTPSSSRPKMPPGSCGRKVYILF